MDTWQIVLITITACLLLFLLILYLERKKRQVSAERRRAAALGRNVPQASQHPPAIFNVEVSKNGQPNKQTQNVSQQTSVIPFQPGIRNEYQGNPIYLQQPPLQKGPLKERQIIIAPVPSLPRFQVLISS